MDARRRTSREKLRGAILRLASDRPVGEITMGSIAVEAGVNRSTVYEHADSPLELLESMLIEELDSYRDARLVGIPPSGVAAAIREVSRDVLEHIERHSGVYRRGLGDAGAGGVLHPMLSRHFRASVRLLIATHEVNPGLVAAEDSDLFTEMTARAIGDATVGAIAAWFDQPEPRDPEAYFRLYRRVMPEWWPH